jgi:hypothetical protein
MADKLLLEMQSVLEDFDRHPPEQSPSFTLAASGSSSYDHSGRLPARR